MSLTRDFLRMSTQHRTVLCYLLLSLWIFLLIAGNSINLYPFTNYYLPPYLQECKSTSLVTGSSRQTSISTQRFTSAMKSTSTSHHKPNQTRDESWPIYKATGITQPPHPITPLPLSKEFVILQMESSWDKKEALSRAGSCRE